MTTANPNLESHYSSSYRLSRSQDQTSIVGFPRLAEQREIQDEILTRINNTNSIDGVEFLNELGKTKDRTFVALAIWDLIDHHVIAFQGDRRESLAFTPQPYEFGPSSGEY